MIEFTMPSLGSDMDEGKLDEWLVKPGDAIERGQVVAVVETTKAAVDVECWHEGTVHELRVSVGETVPVGAVLATLLEPGENAPSAPAPPSAPAVVTPVAAPAERRPAAPPAVAPVAAPVGRRRVSPAARREAQERGIDIASVEGAGPGDSVTLDDVRRFGERAQSTPSPLAGADKAADIRTAIAAAMSRSKREIPHYYLAEEISLDKALAWLEEQNAQRSVTERLLLAVLQLKAVAVATREFQEMNGFWQDGGFRPAPAPHLGVAISLRQGGLIAPAIHNVADKSLDQLMSDLLDLVKRVRAGSLRSSEMSDPTLTVTNLGDQGVDLVFGVIYPPQVALVGFGKPKDRPWAEAGELRVGRTVIASLAADHRASDGHRGALFLSKIHELLQHPEQL
ncbi:MAG: dihydrolipoamide acetyltransferase family protein [Mycobacteriaceae bacterium]